MSLEAKAAARRERISRRQKRPAAILTRRADLPNADVPKLRIGNVNIRTSNRQIVDERGRTTRQPPRRTRP